MIAAQSDRSICRSSAILDTTGRPMRVEVRPAGNRLSGLHRTGVDAAAANRHTDAHFADADGRPLAAVLGDDLTTVRDRLRYEIRNNGDGKGMVDTLCTAVVATGPALQVNTGEDALDHLIQEEWSAWCEDCDWSEPDISLGDHLVFGLREQCLAGEDFLLPVTDAEHPGAVKLRLQPIAPERVSSPWGAVGRQNIRDGVEYDSAGRKAFLHVADAHPKDTTAAAVARFGKHSRIPARSLLHSFIRIEAGQHRGFPWFTPALPVLSQMRRYCLAVLSAAETAADLSVVIHSQAQAWTDEDAQAIDPMDVISLARNAALTLPVGWEAKQFESKQPTVTYTDYTRSLLAQQGRALMMPYNVAAADSSQHNFASGRMDHAMFGMAKAVLRNWIARRKLKRIFALWLAEARLAYAPLRGLTRLEILRMVRTAGWVWSDTNPHGDPLKEQKAITESLHNGSATFQDVCASRGQDWEIQLAKKHAVDLRRLQLAAERKAAARELGLSADEASAALAVEPAAHSNADRDEDESTPQGKDATDGESTSDQQAA